MKQLDLTERQAKYLRQWLTYIQEADRWASNTERFEMLEVGRKVYNLLNPYVEETA